MQTKYFKKPLIILLAMAFINIGANCQILNFINYTEAPAMYNPGMLSSINRAQVTIIYRNSKITNDVSNFTTMVGLQLTLGAYFNKLNLGTVSISAFDDHSNYAPSIKNTGMALAYSQPVTLSTRSFLSIGIQCNVYEKRLDLNNFSTGSQWDPNIGFDPTLTNNETKFYNHINQYSFNSGLYWQLNSNSNRPKAYAGASLYNINRPNESFSGQSNLQPRRYLVHGGYTIGDNYFGNIAVDALFIGQDKQKVAGVGLKGGIYYGTASSNIGEISLSTRILSNNTFMVGASIEQNWLQVGISYDVLTSQTVTTDYHSNAMELFLKVRFGKSKKQAIAPSETSSGTYKPGQKRVFVEERKTEVIENFTADSTSLKRVASASDTTNTKYEPIKLALKRDFKFAFNDAVLDKEAKAYLDELTALMKRNKNITLEVIGHTDDVGSKEGNSIISVKRAQIVADYLMANGIDKRRITIKGKMDSEPLYPNTTPENRAKNRRVEFIIYN